MPASASRIFAEIATAEPPQQTPVVLGKAVVLGGSVAGLLAARVLADQAEKVVIIEPDEPDRFASAPRAVPQATQIHVLLPAGRVQLDRWFPGFSRQAVAEGAVMVSPQSRKVYLDGKLKVMASDIELLSCSRPFLEQLIRTRTLELPNVTTIAARATGLRIVDGSVTGAHYTAAGGDAVESADLVVDAMGRSSRLSDWLEQGGWDRPPLRRMTVDLNYATALFRGGPNMPADRTTLVLNSYTPTASHEAAGTVFSAIENDRWIVTVAGYAENRPGRTAEDLQRWCRNGLPAELSVVLDNEMLGDVRTYRHPDSRRREFSALQRFPAGLISVGDAVASFNPVYGQGMSCAALHASCLSMYLRSAPDLSTPARKFFALQRVVVDAAWRTSTFADLALPHVDGPYPRGYRLSKWASDQIVAASVTDPDVGRLFDEVTGMLRHPSSLATPGTLLTAVRANWRARRKG